MGTEKSGRLRRVLGLGFGLAVSVGATIGVGILRTPGVVAGQVHTPSTVVFLWTAAGLYTLLGASCLSELGTMLPQDGGYYVYVRHAFGNTAGFAVGWTDWLTYCSVLAYISIAIAEFIAVFAPPVGSAVRFVAIGILIGIVALQWMGIRISSQFQEITTLLKCVAFVALIVACLLVPARQHTTEGSIAPSMTFSGVVIALQAIVITYGGWQSPLYFTEEDRNPSRNLPRTMVGGVFSVIVIYLLVNIALLNVLSMSGLASATLPAADAAQVIAGPRGRDLITALSVISLVPVLNAVMMIGARVIFAMGRDRLFWSRTFDCQRRWYTADRDAVDHYDCCGSYRNRDVSTTHRDDLILSGSELLPLLPRPNHTALSRTRGTATVPGLGVSVVGLDRRSWCCDFFGWNHGGRHA